MSDVNPYSPPRHDEPAPLPRTAGGWRLEGRRLIVEKGATLPNVCIVDGHANDLRRVRRKLSWATPALVVLVLCSPLIYLGAYFLLRKTGELDYALSETARRRRVSGLLIGWGGVLLGLALFVAGIAFDAPLLSLVALVVILAALVVGAVRARMLQIACIDEREIHLRLTPAAAEGFAAAARVGAAR